MKDLGEIIMKGNAGYRANKKWRERRKQEKGCICCFKPALPNKNYCKRHSKLKEKKQWE